jgi:hypothetical protein
MRVSKILPLVSSIYHLPLVFYLLSVITGAGLTRMTAAAIVHVKLGDYVQLGVEVLALVTDLMDFAVLMEKMSWRIENCSGAFGWS